MLHEIMQQITIISIIINHTLLRTIGAVISTLTCMSSMASNSTSNGEHFLGCTSTSKSTVVALIVRGLKCVIN